MNAAALNFNLQTNSPAIDAGQLLSLVTTDIKNNPRPQGTNYDIGEIRSRHWIRQYATRCTSGLERQVIKEL